MTLNGILKMTDNPYLGEQLKGQFRVFRSLHIKLTNVHYRVIYEVAEAQQKIYVHVVGKRENFYDRLERMKLKSTKAARSTWGVENKHTLLIIYGAIG